MQTARPTIPTNTPSIRPGGQTPTAAVYPTNQAIMMTMAPMPFPSPQAAQYYIPQVRPAHVNGGSLLLNIAADNFNYLPIFQDQLHYRFLKTFLKV